MKAVVAALGLSARKFCFAIGKSDGWVSSLNKNKADAITSDVLRKILDTFPMVNREYLLDGSGSPLLDETDTLDDIPGYEPEADDYKELCMAYRRELADMREEARRLRNAYMDLLDSSNRILESCAMLQAACLKAGVPLPERDKNETSL